MAKVATAGTLPSNSHQIGGGSLKMGPSVKRKTPSELRGEQLKRTNVTELVDESPEPLLGSTSNSSEVGSGLTKPDILRNPRYVDTRMDEVYPVKKSRFRMLSKKENEKDDSSINQPSSLKNLSTLSNIVAKRREQLSSLGSSVASDTPKSGVVQARQTIEKCCQSLFRSVTELSLGGERSPDLATVDMNKALKGLVACEPVSGLPADSSERFGDPSTYSGNFRSECHIPGQKTPLDFTLKTYMRVVSSSSVNWIHRSIMSGVYNGLPQFTFHPGSEDSNGSGNMLASQVLSSKTLHSWVYPQSTLPISLISLLTSSATEGDTDFLRKRQMAWEDSFRSLYYMFRKNACNIFYVCTSHFVVMFIGSNGLGSKRSCNAYVSQSTRGLRSFLKEHDVSFSMPLCQSKVEQVTTEDLVELSEIEKHNLGQTRRSNSFSDIDNTPQSLLAFSNNKSVHALYDFLLNYRSFLTVLTATDVPALYSPVPFQNATLSAPEISCTEMKRSDSIAAHSKKSITKDCEATQRSPDFCCSIEIKAAYLPPWIISNICYLVGSEGKNFDASFTTERASVGLNVALNAVVSEKSDALPAAGEGLEAPGPVFGIPEAIVTPYLSSGYLKSLEYSNGSYKASLSPL